MRAIMARAESLTDEGLCPSAQLMDESAVAFEAAVRLHKCSPVGTAQSFPGRSFTLSSGLCCRTPYFCIPVSLSAIIRLAQAHWLVAARFRPYRASDPSGFRSARRLRGAGCGKTAALETGDEQMLDHEIFS
jgi:hypothetical protein